LPLHGPKGRGLEGCRERNAHSDEHVWRRGRQTAKDRNYHNFQTDYRQIGISNPAEEDPPIYSVSGTDPEKEAEDRHQVMQRLPPVSLHCIQTQKNNVAGHRIGEHVTVAEVGERI
jgi:hypothetical protein